jgi:hypothetical protein
MPLHRRAPHPVIEGAGLFLGLVLLGSYLALPWFCLIRFGSLAAIAGGIAAHVLYRMTLAPRGICLGMPWVAVAGNFIVVVLVTAQRLFW